MITRTHAGLWRKLTASLACVLLSALIACSSGSSSSTSSHLAYVAGGQTNVIGLRINSTGSTQTILGSPFVAGNGPSSTVVHPSNRFLFVSNQGEGTISLFTIDATSGALTEVLPRTPAGTSPVAMTMDSGGTFLFVANQGASPSILVFSIGSSGALSAVGTPAAIGSAPSGITLTSAGSFLYVPVPNFSAIYAFAVSSGTLTQLGSPFFVGGGVETVAVDPAGKFLFVPNPSTGTVTVLKIQPDGSLAAGAGAFAASTTPVAASTDLSGAYLYVANFGSTTVSQYTIDSTTGALTTFTTTSTPTAGTNATFVVPDPNGKFIYVGNQGSSSISEFTIKPDGALTSTNNSIPLGLQPRSLSVAK